jgi:hypothetical protein
MWLLCQSAYFKSSRKCILSPGLNFGFAVLNSFGAKRKKLSEEGKALV